MIAGLRPQAGFLRRNAALLNDTSARRDVVLYLPFRRWLDTSQCQASRLAAEMARANIQFEVICEDAFRLKSLRGARVLVAGSDSDFSASERGVLEQFSYAGGVIITAEKAGWLKQVQSSIGKPAIVVTGAPRVRAVVRDQPHRTLVHLLNLDVERVTSFEDKVTPVSELRVALRVPMKKVRSVRALTADAGATSGPLKFTATPDGAETLVETTVPSLHIASILMVE